MWEAVVGGVVVWLCGGLAKSGSRAARPWLRVVCVMKTIHYKLHTGINWGFILPIMSEEEAVSEGFLPEDWELYPRDTWGKLEEVCCLPGGWGIEQMLEEDG